MSPNRKILFILIFLVLTIVTSACSSTQLNQAGGSETEIPEEPNLPAVTATTAITAPVTATTVSVTATTAPVTATTAPVTATTEPIVQKDPPYIEHVSGQVNIKAGESGTASASCPVGSITVGGGFASEHGMIITKTMPDGAGWMVGGVNGSDRDLSLTAYAYCLHNDTGKIRVVTSDELLSGNPRAVCVEGEIVTGGGYFYETNTLNVYISTPIGDSVNGNNSWAVYADNLQGTDQTIRVYALCLSESSLTSTLVRDEYVAYESKDSVVSFTLTCPAGAIMASGGYEGRNAFISRANPAYSNQWEGQSPEKYFLDGTLDHAVCLNLP